MIEALATSPVIVKLELRDNNITDKVMELLLSYLVLYFDPGYWLHRSSSAWAGKID